MMNAKAILGLQVSEFWGGGVVLEGQTCSSIFSPFTTWILEFEIKNKDLHNIHFILAHPKKKQGI